MSVTAQLINDVIRNGTRAEIIDCISEHAYDEFEDDQDLWDLAKENMSELKNRLRNIRDWYL